MPHGCARGSNRGIAAGSLTSKIDRPHPDSEPAARPHPLAQEPRPTVSTDIPERLARAPAGDGPRACRHGGLLLTPSKLFKGFQRLSKAFKGIQRKNFRKVGQASRRRLACNPLNRQLSTINHFVAALCTTLHHFAVISTLRRFVDGLNGPPDNAGGYPPPALGIALMQHVRYRRIERGLLTTR